MTGGHAWQGGMCEVWQGVCMAGGMSGGMAGGHVWQGACMAGGMHGRGYVWQGACVAGCVCVGGMCGRGGMHGRGVCMAGGYAWQGGMHGGHAWGACMAGRHVWQGVCMAGGAWQERQPLQQVVRILLECILVIFIIHQWSSEGYVFSHVCPSVHRGFHVTISDDALDLTV